MANLVNRITNADAFDSRKGRAMTDEQSPLKPGDEKSTSAIDDQIDQLLPVPDGGETEQHHMTGQIDELLPVPGVPSDAADDASTREELEVDTTRDDVDDIIPVTAPQANDEVIEEHQETETTEAEPEASEGSATTNSCIVCGATVGGSRFCPECGTEQVATSQLVARLTPFFLWSRPLAVRATLTIAALLALIALLTDSGATALIISAAVVPVVLLITIALRIEDWTTVSWVQNGMMLLIGLVVGLPLAWIATRIVKRSWIDGGVLQFGATSFGGVAAETAGSAPFLVWLVVGLLLPIVVLVVIAAAPAGLRMALSMNPREGTGMMLSASVAAGYVIGAAIIFYLPLGSELPPIMSTSQWTLTILGLAVIRPIIWVTSGAMLGAVMWRYMATASMPEVAIPAAMAVGLPILFSLLSLAVAPAGLWPAVLMGIVFAGVGMFLLRRFEESARKHDAMAVGATRTI